MKKTKMKKILIICILIAGIGVAILPFFWMITTAFKTQGDPCRCHRYGFQRHGTWMRIMEIIKKGNFLKAYGNTIISTVITVIGQVALCATAGYSFARVRFPGRIYCLCLFLEY